jgi:lipid A 3-O-deacylase
LCSDAAPAHAATSWLDDAMFNVELDNDFFTPQGSDQHYTNGVRLEVLSRPISGKEVPEWSRKPYDIWPAYDLSAMRRVGLTLGQNIYTPTDTDSRVPDPKDRPYAAWAYLGAILATETYDRLDTVELDIGMVGPAAGGRDVQNGFHELINVSKANGWESQIHNEPGVVLSAERRWRFGAPRVLPGQLEADAIPIAGASVGNVMTYANGGLMLRIGQGLGVDFGPPRIRPALPGSPGIGAAVNGFGWYLFAGIDGRAVARDIFLDGNTFRDSPSVDKKPLVADLEVGFAVLIGQARMTYTYVERTPEFHGQAGPDRFGALSFTWRF